MKNLVLIFVLLSIGCPPSTLKAQTSTKGPRKKEVQKADTKNENEDEIKPHQANKDVRTDVKKQTIIQKSEPAVKANMPGKDDDRKKPHKPTGSGNKK